QFELVGSLEGLFLRINRRGRRHGITDRRIFLISASADMTHVVVTNRVDSILTRRAALISTLAAGTASTTGTVSATGLAGRCLVFMYLKLLLRPLLIEELFGAVIVGDRRLGNESQQKRHKSDGCAVF